MIISRGRGYVFVHIPKTGGTALSLALEAKAMKDDILIGDTPKARARRGRLRGLNAAGRVWKHSRLCDIEGVLSPAEIEALRIFTVVRNPWDRMVSYYHWLRAQGFAHPAVALARTTDFSGFLNHPSTRIALTAAPYGSYVRTAAGAERCDLFLRLERIDEDVARLEVLLGLRLGRLARANPSDRVADWRGYYSAADAELVGRIAAEDIARFGYGFDPG